MQLTDVNVDSIQPKYAHTHALLRLTYAACMLHACCTQLSDVNVDSIQPKHAHTQVV